MIYLFFFNVHNKKYYSFFVKCYFILVFDNNFCPCIESDFHTNTTICYWKNYLINAIQDFFNQGSKLSHISNIKILTIIIKMNMTYDYYIIQSIRAVEGKLNMIIDKNPRLIISLNRFHNHPLNRKYPHIPFNNY